jgi:hypothetical protein
LSDIAQNIRSLRQQVGEAVKIVAVSKTKPVKDILEAYNAGQRIFGENRVNELVTKKKQAPADIEWHFIGHLQTNKVKLVVPHADMIQSVDSLRLLEIIDRESKKAGKVTDCLLQFHIAREETKFGFSTEEADRIFTEGIWEKFGNLRLRGVMGMATFTDNISLVRDEFRYLRKCFEHLKEDFFINSPHFSEISMGMSGDYRVAIEESATMIRIGSLIFGDRIKQ